VPNNSGKSSTCSMVTVSCSLIPSAYQRIHDFKIFSANEQL
jgi:hypothetical protein